MPPPTAGLPGTETSGGFLPFQAKLQKLRSSVSSNSLQFLTPGRAKILPPLVSNVPGRPAVGGSAEGAPIRHFLYETPSKILQLLESQFSLWLVFTAMYVYMKYSAKNGVFQSSLCPLGHDRYIKIAN